MNIVDIANIVGYAACITMVLGYLPQTIKTIRTRKTDDIALGTFLLMAVGAFLFAVQGAMLDNYPLLITNCLTASLSSIVFGIKMYNDYFKKK